MDRIERLQKRLERIYGPRTGALAYETIRPLIHGSVPSPRAAGPGLSESDIILITYGDSLQETGTSPLQSLSTFAARYLEPAFSAIHILPFFPYSSDDGFSVTDFFSVDPALGSWDDIGRIGARFQLMFDLVLNHVSAGSDWVRRYLDGEPGFENLAIAVPPETDLSAVVRPRSLPLLTPFVRSDGGTVHLWTTFSPDQVDLNYQDPATLEKMLRVMLFYVQQGARILRLDAIAYLWKSIGTSCIHLDRTHEIVKLFRTVLELVAPDTRLLTETNVPHPENIRYFGTDGDEAQMVYNFTLPPLLLHAFTAGNAGAFCRWARGLRTPHPDTTFFNFTASHDGIGVRPLEGILPADEIQRLVDRVTANGGLISYRQQADGTPSPYELNITYMDALARDTGDEPLLARRFLTSHAIQLALPGVPGIYIHSLIGSRNWHEGVQVTGRARSINREKLHLPTVVDQLGDPNSFRSSIFFPLREMCRVRRRMPAFHPAAGFEILETDSRLVGIRRGHGARVVFVLANVSECAMTVDLTDHSAGRLEDLMSGRHYSPEAVGVEPYGFLWLRPAVG